MIQAGKNDGKILNKKPENSALKHTEKTIKQE
jgi:hypothetical protein